jgi:hypothetical protein
MTPIITVTIPAMARTNRAINENIEKKVDKNAESGSIERIVCIIKWAPLKNCPIYIIVLFFVK